MWEGEISLLVDARSEEDVNKCCTTCKNPISEVAIRDIQSGFYRAGIGERPLKLHPTTRIGQSVVDYLAANAVKTTFTGDFHPYDADLAEHMQRAVCAAGMMGWHEKRAVAGLAGHKPPICNAVETIAAQILGHRLNGFGSAREGKGERPVQLRARPLSPIDAARLLGRFRHLHVMR